MILTDYVKFYLLIVLGMVMYLGNIYAQAPTIEPEYFYFDAVVFEGSNLDSSRIDCYIVVPYDKLNFLNSDNFYSAGYNVELLVFDSISNKVFELKYDRAIREDDYFASKGGTGKFDYTQKIMYLPSGKYRIKAVISDKFNKQQYERSRNINVISFNKFDIALSGILLVSTIEENNGRYKITPHISDNIGNLDGNYFTFLEIYSNFPKQDSVDLVWEVLDTKEAVIAQGIRKRYSTSPKKQQAFLQIPPINEMTTGSYSIRIIALKPDTSYNYTTNDYLAVAQRTIKYMRTFSGSVLSDLNSSIKQLRYVAFQQDVDYIEEAKTQQEKQTRFEQFWKKKDPTANTDRNEAFEEYYQRIDYANKNFRSYTEGWLTDKGMVYVVFGPPSNVERQQGYGDSRTYERWSYRTNREFIFADKTGFGDFRLERPIAVTEKYQYNR